jgi:hypothetical protein
VPSDMESVGSSQSGAMTPVRRRAGGGTRRRAGAAGMAGSRSASRATSAASSSQSSRSGSRAPMVPHAAEDRVEVSTSPGVTHITSSSSSVDFRAHEPPTTPSSSAASVRDALFAAWNNVTDPLVRVGVRLQGRYLTPSDVVDLDDRLALALVLNAAGFEASDAGIPSTMVAKACRARISAALHTRERYRRLLIQAEANAIFDGALPATLVHHTHFTTTHAAHLPSATRASKTSSAPSPSYSNVMDSPPWIANDVDEDDRVVRPEEPEHVLPEDMDKHAPEDEHGLAWTPASPTGPSTPLDVRSHGLAWSDTVSPPATRRRSTPEAAPFPRLSPSPVPQTVAMFNDIMYDDSSPRPPSPPPLRPSLALKDKMDDLDDVPPPDTWNHMSALVPKLRTQTGPATGA